MQADVVIRGGTLILPNGLVRADVVINEGRIALLTSDSRAIHAERRLEATGKYVLPGVIDAHVHFGIYSGSFENDVRTETRSMAVGGVTTPIHFLQASGSYLPVVEAARRTVQERALVDVAFQVILMNQRHLDELPRYSSRGIGAGKIYMNGKEYRNIGIESEVDDAFLFRAFWAARQLRFLPKLHCENYELACAIGAIRAMDEGDGLAAWDAFRPAVCEEEAMRRAILIARHTGTPIYIVHNSTAAAEHLAAETRMNQQQVWFETCPHYLTFTHDGRIGILGKVNPPIRSAADRESLWRGIQRGLIHTIASDHAPNRRAAKRGRGDIWTALLGFGGSTFILPALFTEGVRKRNLDLPTVTRITAYNVARIHGIRGKGLLAAGYDADLVVVDPKRTWKVTPERLASYADYSLFDGREMTGWPVYTLSRGRVVAEGFELAGHVGHAAVVPCGASLA